MSVDIYQLPIPDWGLHCPNCRYPLVGLPSHRCPECGMELNMEALVKPWHRTRPPRFSGNELPWPDFGLDCTACGMALAGAGQHGCPRCGKPFDLEDWLPAGESFVVDQVFLGEVPVLPFEAMLRDEGVPYRYVAGKTVGDIYGLTSGTAVRLEVPTDFYLEVCYLRQQARREMEAGRRQMGQTWRCPRCGEDVPGHFELCWNCQTPRKPDAG